LPKVRNTSHTKADREPAAVAAEDFVKLAGSLKWSR